MICVLFGVSYAQKSDTTHAIGKDKDGDMWYLDTDLVVRPKPPADWMLIVPMYTLLPGRGLIFYFNVDCSDSTYQLTRAQVVDVSGRVLVDDDKKTAWAKFVGHTGAGARLACTTFRNKTTRLPAINDGKTDGR